MFGLSSYEAQAAVSLLIAALLGAAMGLERSLSGKHAGMRTYALVSLGSCAFVVVGTIASLKLSLFSGLNPLIIASNVVVGIGFIGAGLAAFSREHPVELTTATGIWVAAAVGMAAGYQLFGIALSVVVISVVILAVLSKIEHRLRQKFGSETSE